VNRGNSKACPERRRTGFQYGCGRGGSANNRNQANQGRRFDFRPEIEEGISRDQKAGRQQEALTVASGSVCRNKFHEGVYLLQKFFFAWFFVVGCVFLQSAQANSANSASKTFDGRFVVIRKDSGYFSFEEPQIVLKTLRYDWSAVADRFNSPTAHKTQEIPLPILPSIYKCVMPSSFIPDARKPIVSEPSDRSPKRRPNTTDDKNCYGIHWWQLAVWAVIAFTIGAGLNLISQSLRRGSKHDR
jgi:hypothetical protein